MLLYSHPFPQLLQSSCQLQMSSKHRSREGYDEMLQLVALPPLCLPSVLRLRVQTWARRFRQNHELELGAEDFLALRSGTWYMVTALRPNPAQQLPASLSEQCHQVGPSQEGCRDDEEEDQANWGRRWPDSIEGDGGREQGLGFMSRGYQDLYRVPLTHSICE